MGGPILLLALLKWRKPEARTLLAMAVMPQLTLFYDQLPLWLVPTTAWRSLAMSVLSWVAWAQWYPNREVPAHVAIARPWIFALIYLPALVFVLAADKIRWRRNAPALEPTNSAETVS
jgi:hypothetical protein